MNTLICPVSFEKINGTAVRITGFLVAVSAVAYLLTGNVYILTALLIDFTIRAFSPLKFSPLSFIASKTAIWLRLPTKMINKAPKLFAARIGFMFTVLALLFHGFVPVVSIGLMMILVSCALLEAVLDFCVGCVVYTYLVLPWNNRVGGK